MILGLGTDLVDIRHVEQRLSTYRDKFRPAERDFCDARHERMAAYATRFAIKEATMKALGADDATGGVGLIEIEVVTSVSGRPTVVLHGGAIRQLKAITPEGMEAHVSVSATDHFPFAHGMAVIWI